ncbi:MAG: sensor histidine kinase [Deltaproteobacteria bacterium]|nr:sensor histidine kinase [Deltaproteobacteria bacterium]
MREASAALARIESRTYEAAILKRDYLLQAQEADPDAIRRDLLRMRAESRSDLATLERANEEGLGAGGSVAVLGKKLDIYWETFDPLLKSPVGDGPSPPDVSRLMGIGMPKRVALLAMTREIQGLNLAAAQRERDRLDRSRENHARSLTVAVAGALVLSLTVAVFAVGLTRRLEERSSRQRSRAEEAEQELRRLSHQLVRAQEDERRALSRELHDEVGQKLTGIRLELARLDRLRTGPAEPFQEELAETKSLVEESMKAVRDLAMGLRPSMLDDLGLEPAMGWQTREFSRRSGVGVRLDYGADVGELPDAVCTCLYRVAQEALTNCARHAKAENVFVSVRREPDGVVLEVEDDGVGFEPLPRRGGGLGLVGIEERVRELGGGVTISSRLYLGTRLTARIPLPPKEVPT